MSDILLSYPRSGNHLVRYILEFITGLPTSGCYGNTKDKPIYTNQFPNKETPLRHVVHNFHFCFTKFHKIPSHYNSAYLKSDPSLILIIRDYKECIISHLRKINKDKEIDSLTFQHELNLYFKLLNYYDNFEGKKMIIYYEDLIQKTDEVLNQLKNFIPNIQNSFYLDFLKNIDHHCYLSSNGKNRSWGGSNSNREISFHFTNSNPSEKKNILDTIKIFRKTHTPLFRKYLKPYLERNKIIYELPGNSL